MPMGDIFSKLNITLGIVIRLCMRECFHELIICSEKPRDTYWFTPLLVYFICHSISSKKNLVIKLNGDDTKNNIALSINILMTVISKL